MSGMFVWRIDYFVHAHIYARTPFPPPSGPGPFIVSAPTAQDALTLFRQSPETATKRLMRPEITSFVCVGPDTTPPDADLAFLRKVGKADPETCCHLGGERVESSRTPGRLSDIEYRCRWCRHHVRGPTYEIVNTEFWKTHEPHR